MRKSDEGNPFQFSLCSVQIGINKKIPLQHNYKGIFFFIIFLNYFAFKILNVVTQHITKPKAKIAQETNESVKESKAKRKNTPITVTTAHKASEE